MAYKIIDLTHTLENRMIKFNANWHINTEIKELGKICEVGRNTKKITIGTHAGTHIDAPLHFISGGDSIEDISLNSLVGDVTIIDLTFLEPNSMVSVDMLKNYDFSKRVILKYGWGVKWNKKEFYYDYPYLSEEVAAFFIKRGVKVIGMDTPSPDSSHTKLLSEEDSKIHKMFLSNGIILIEYLNLESINDFCGWTLIALPLKIECGDGSPSRVILLKGEL